jgi:thioredoxin-dependent peroxiredoxin
MSHSEIFPAFSLPDQNGQMRSLADLSGSKGLVLYIYPKDDTPGCTTEALDFKNAAAALEGHGYKVAGLSRDSAESHCKFIAKHGLNFALLTDPSGDFLTTIGAWGEKKNYGKVFLGIIRSTFVISRDGQVLKAYRNVKATGHVERVVRELLASAP